ncbi:MAG: hypothetical protein ACKVQU_37280 [Burkholderiales bacterium]
MPTRAVKKSRRSARENTVSSEPVKEYAKEFALLPTSVVSDALDRLGVKGQCTGLRSLSLAGTTLCGRVFTVQFVPCGTPDARTPNGDIGDCIDDVLLGDGDGVVVVPRDYLSQTLAAARQIAAMGPSFR